MAATFRARGARKQLRDDDNMQIYMMIKAR